MLMHRNVSSKLRKMPVKRIQIEQYFTSDEYDPSPNRISPEEKPVSERKIPIIYTCENCGNQILIKKNDFEKHKRSEFSNIDENNNQEFDKYLKGIDTKGISKLDFHCPNCNQPTLILFEGGPSGYWGEFEFKILSVLVNKK
jgi:DNA-directed RNA polymerase subunit M/transcription elongation factor TFIIS